jgi:iron complex transport system substrate-binding protein
MWTTGGPALMAVAALLISDASAAAARTSSLNLCTDGWLLELVEDSAIGSLTHLSRDPDLSPHHHRAARLAQNHGHAEEIVRQGATLVLAGPSTSPATLHLIARAGIDTLRLPHAATFADYRRNLLTLARRLNREPRARTVLAASAYSATRVRPHGPRAVIYQANGYTPGPGSVMAEVLRAAGYRWFGVGTPAGAFMSTEQMLMKMPDVIVISTRANPYPTLADAKLRQRPLRKWLQHSAAPRVVRLPEAWWTCASAANARAVLRLRAARS